MTIELPVTVEEMHRCHVDQNRISDARVAIFRFAGRSRKSYQKIMGTLRSKGVNLAELSLDQLKAEVHTIGKQQFLGG
jgi:hypothetical protein